MDVAGAIFDCDGTLVDSMGMWWDVYAWLVDAYGGVADQDFFKRIEALSVVDTCAAFHDELGMGESAEALYEELLAHVRECYQTTPLFDGAREFLDELAAADIPMIIASSTPVREVRCALAAHGIEGYFCDVVSTEDVGGRDKEFPDVYEEALRRLGTARESTWVFEDAPFGVRTSKRAGFRVVGLFNDHDGRREKDVRPWCDVFVHGYAELSLALLEDFAAEPAEGGANGAPLRALVVDGSPQPSTPALVAGLAAEVDYVIAADRGAETCRAAGVVPDVFCGDDDSVGEQARAWAEAGASTTIRFPSAKYATDLSLALDCARHEAARRGAPLELTVTCASGGRTDHTLAVVGLVAGAAADSAGARLVEDGYEMRALTPEGQASWRLGAEAVGKTLSVMALEPATVVTLRGMQWPLESHELGGVTDDLGISNVVCAPDAEVTCEAGLLVAFLLR